MAAVCLSQEILRNWDKSGKSDFLKLCRGLSDSDSSVKLLQTKNLKRALYEACSAVTHGKLKSDHAVGFFTELKDYLPSVPSSLADILGILDVESSCSDESVREKFLILVNALRQIVPDGLLKERLDQDSLELAGLVLSQQGFNQKYVKTKTRLYYKQQKFNLLREESEGYSKLITELNQDITSTVTCEQVLQNIKSLIGCFDLDPNRVLDIILEAFECHPEEHKFYIPLLRAYIIDKVTLCHILGFKFHFRETSDWSTPKSLFKCAALLLNHDLVDLDDLYPYLLPLDSEIIPFHNKEVSDAKAYAKKLNTVFLSDKKEEDKDKDDQQIIDLRENNQKLGLVEALLEIGAWDSAKAILDRLPEHFAVVHKSISQTLCALVHRVIEPLYDRNTGLPSNVSKKRKKTDRGGCDCQQAHSFQQLYHTALPMLSYLGPHAANDPILVVKVIRLAKTFMNKRQSGGIGPEDDVAYYGFLNVLEEVVLPSLALLPGNCALAEELWNLLKLYPYEIRYRLYGTWKNESYFQYPVLIRARADCLERAKYIMKRLSKETVKPSGRQLGKLSHSNPGIVFEYVLNQIQRYDNLIGPVVDALKYLTSMSYDMLIFCIIEAIANPEKDRMKTDNMNISLWLQSLCQFAGSICRKYQVELTGILQYVANQLKAGKSTDLLLLREVVQKMAGIEVSEEVTDEQLDALAGGELVRLEGGNFSQVRNTKKSSTRLKDTLLEQDLALSLCLLMAQQRDSTVFAEDTNKHLKLVGKLYDQCQDTLVQFGSFLSMQLSTEEFVKRLPAVDVLLSTYHIPHSAAFFLSRPLYAHAINVRYEELKKSEKQEKTEKSEKSEKTEKSDKSKSKSKDNKIQCYVDASEEIMGPIVKAIQPVFSSKIWDDLTPQFYITFWSLSMYDLRVPTAAYQKQIDVQQNQIRAIDSNRDTPSNKKKKEIDRCNLLIEKLEDEMKKQAEHVARVKARLEEEKELWFPTGTLKSEMTTNLLQHCLFPRCCFTASDAVYCGHFIRVLHGLMTPNFSTLITYDRIFNDITHTITSCTDNEAHRYGRFLCSALETVMRWHSSPAIYEKECYNFPGFLTVFRKGMDQSNKMDRLDYENYRHVCHKWHFRLTKSVITCLESKNYSQIRNSLIVLTKILPHFPRMTQIGMAVERRVDKLSKEEKEKRPDIYALAVGYSGQLKTKKTSWVQETEFHIKEPKKPMSNINQQQSQQQKQTDSNSNNNVRKGEEGKTKEIKQEEKKDRGVDGEKEKKKERSAERKEAKEKKEAKRSSGVSESNGAVTVKKEFRPSPEETQSRLAAMETEDDSKHREKPIKEEKVKKSERKDKEASKAAKEKAREEKRERKEREAAAALKEEERHLASKTVDHEREDRGGNGGNHMSTTSSSHRRSAEVSPRHLEDRETKRRRMEAGAASQDSPVEARSKHRKSPTPVDDDVWEMERERERKEKKRDHSMEDYHEVELSKRKKSEEHYSVSRKLNGEANGSASKSYVEREHKEKSSKQSHSSRKEQFVDGDVSPKLKSKEKREKSSSKKQKRGTT